MITPPREPTDTYFIFEVCWDLGDPAGATQRVLASKAQKMTKIFGDHYVLVVPHLERDDQRPACLTPDERNDPWLAELIDEGWRINAFRWDIPGRPRCLLVDFSNAYRRKKEIVAWLLSQYQVTAGEADWDFLEPVLFGYAAGRVVAAYNDADEENLEIVAHWHNWHVAAGLLYLKDHCPGVAQVITLHHTVLGRAIADTGENVVTALEKINGDEKAQYLGLHPPYQLEKAAVQQADFVSTPSAVTAGEILFFHDRRVSLITPNALPDDYPPERTNHHDHRTKMRETLYRVAEAMIAAPLERDRTLLLLSSGSYDYINKGLNLILDAMPHLEEHLKKGDHRVILFLMTPSRILHANRQVVNALNGTAPLKKPKRITHDLYHLEDDPIQLHLNRLEIRNQPEDHIKVIFVPAELNGDDGVFNHSYTDLLPAFDLTLFPAHYQTWGFGPMESLANGVPTLSSDLSGFGNWVSDAYPKHRFCHIMPRTTADYEQATAELAGFCALFVAASPEQRRAWSEEARKLAANFHWTLHIRNYLEAYHEAMTSRDRRYHGHGRRKKEPSPLYDGAAMGTLVSSGPPIMKPFTVLNLLPAALRRLRELAYNLWWSWHPQAAQLFADLDLEAWHESGHNPVELLDSVPQEKLNDLAQDPVFLERLDTILEQFDAYHTQRNGPKQPEVAFISYQYTLHECLPLFFSSAGTFAGDYLKTAGDLDFPLVALGLAFHHGTPSQRFDLQGNFHSEFRESDFTSQPIRPLKHRDGSLFTIRIAFPGRRLTLQVWRVEIGAVSLYLLDSDHPDNSDLDRLITQHCNPPDAETRLQQCMILGIGSRLLLQELGIKPKLWHLNDCHGAFVSFSRAAQLVHNENLPFEAAMAFIRETTMMTVFHAGAEEETHQGVVFEEDTIRPYFNLYRHTLAVSWQQITALGAQPGPRRRGRFSLNLLGIRSAARLSAKNRSHRAQIQQKLQPLAAGFHAAELPIAQVTEAIHPTSWITPDLRDALNKTLGADWALRRPSEVPFNQVLEMPEKDLRRARLKAKARLLHEVRRHLEHTWHHRRDSPSLLTKIIGTMRDDALIIGFTHHLALSPRANLLFRDPTHLARLLNGEDRPVIVLFASHILPGTHEHDDDNESERKQAEKLVKAMFHLSRREEFLGRLIFLENFDLFLNRMLVQGCDLWLNAPSHPGNYDMLSGIMAAANGALNLSVPDGWWVEADNGQNGWTIGKNLPVANRDYRDEFDSQHLYLLLEQNLIPLYFHDCLIGPSHEWLERSRRAIAQVIDNFSSHRLMREYNRRFYQDVFARRGALEQDSYEACQERARRRELYLAGWQRLAVLETSVEGLREESVCHGMDVHVEVHLRHENLPANMLRVEFVTGVRDHAGHQLSELIVHQLKLADDQGGESFWRGIYVPTRNGPKAYGIRVIPAGDGLDLSFPLVKWAR